MGAQQSSISVREDSPNSNVEQSSANITETLANVEQYLKSSGFTGMNEVPNPESSVNVNDSNEQLEFVGGTFTVSSDLHGALADSLEHGLRHNSSDEFIGGANKSTEVRVLHLLHDGISKLNTEYSNISNAISDKISNLHSLQTLIKKGLNRLADLVDTNKSEAKVITEVQEALLKEIDRQLILLQNLVKVNIKPTKESLTELLKKNKNFTTLAETLGTGYNTEEASDRLALVFTNISQLGLASERVREALKTLNISLKEYGQVKNMGDLEKKITNVMKSLKGKKHAELEQIMKAIQVLKNSQMSHDKIVKCMENPKNCMKSGGADEPEVFTDEPEVFTDEPEVFTDEPEVFTDEPEVFTDEPEVFTDEVEGGDYTSEVGRSSRPRVQSVLSKRIKTYEQTMKELFRSFMNQVNSNFKELSKLIDLLSTKVGSEIAYDDDLQKFIKMFSGLNESLDNEKIFYSLINLDSSVAGKEIKARFHDNLDTIIVSCNQLKDYKLFNDISKTLQSLKNNIDTYSDTVLSLQKSEGQKSGANEEFAWTDKLLETSFATNNIKLIKNSIKKLSFFGKVSSIKQNLLRMNKEHKENQEDYDKLLGKSIGVKLSELNKEYVENVDRLNDKTRGRGLLLENHNMRAVDPVTKKPTDAYLPRGLVENIYKIQYEAKEGLYKTVEAIDLYLMNFTELLSGNPEAVMDLNKMLEQTEIIAKWFNKKSVDNLSKVLNDQVSPDTDKTINDINNIIQKSLNIDSIVFNKPILGQRVKDAYEQCKKAIDSISALKNIVSMFVHIGEKFGNQNLTAKSLMSPNVIYKNLVKYIWVSAFSMGYGTAGGDKTVDISSDAGKGAYELEKGDVASFFNIVLTTIILPLDVYKEMNTTVQQTLNAKLNSNPSEPEKELIKKVQSRLQNRDIFIVDDKYFVLTIKAMVGKILTVIDTHSLLQTPSKLTTIMNNPVRTILGASENTEIIADAVELYVRLPLLVEFYKHIFSNGNKEYKDKKDKTMSELEVIAFIPEIGTVWTGLIQCIFDESRYIDQGIYNMNNMKNIIHEINNIYKSYSRTVSKDKLVKTVILDLVAEVNRRYGILKEKDIAEFYQIKKKYQKFPNDMTFEESVNLDILDENNEYQLEGPSSMYVEKQFNKANTESAMNINDIKIVKEFRNKIYNELFGNAQINVEDLSKKSFNEKIKYYKKQIVSTNSMEEKFELIISAIDQSSNVNAHNVDAYLLCHELVLAPVQLLEDINNYVVSHVREMNNGLESMSQVMILNNLNKWFNDNNLFKLKMVANNKVIIDYSNLQMVVESYIENIKYNISKFRSTICKDIIKKHEERVFKIENELLNIVIKNDSNSENYESFVESNKEVVLELFNNNVNKAFAQTKNNSVSELYSMIQFSKPTANKVVRQNKLLDDVNSVYDSARKTWTKKTNISHLDYLIAKDGALTNADFRGKSILEKFNMIVFNYVNNFYNPATKKIYSKLVDEFANKSLSAVIYENGGIPDMFENVNVPNAVNVNMSKINNNSPLALSLTTVLKTLLTRNLSTQLPLKLHLLENLADVSSVQVEKYKTYLPVYITYLTELIAECNVYKRVLDNSSIVMSDPSNQNLTPDALLKNNAGLTDDNGVVLNYLENLQNGDDTFEAHKANFHALLNNITNGARSLINDAKNVLSEVNHVPQLGNLYDNFIKNFYNNNGELPYMPISILNNINEKSLELLPEGIHTNKSKFINYSNYVLNNEANNKDQDVNNYLWLKEQVKLYNNSALSTNVLDTKKVNQLLTNNKHILNYLYLSNHVHSNLYHTSSTVNTFEFTGGVYFRRPNNNNLNSIINMIENTFTYNKKLKIVNEILLIAPEECKDKSLDNYNLDRNEARVLNIIDLNIMPINIHALLREVPLINIYNYAATFDDIIASSLNAPQNLQSSNTSDLSGYKLLGALLQDPYYVNPYLAAEGRYKNLVQRYLSSPNNNDDNPNKDMHLSTPKYLVNALEAINAVNKSKDEYKLIYNNKFLRNIIFLVNIQRVIRLKLKSAVYRINNNVVSSDNIMNMRITEYADQKNTNINDDEFEITDLF